MKTYITAGLAFIILVVMLAFQGCRTSKVITQVDALGEKVDEKNTKVDEKIAKMEGAIESLKTKEKKKSEEKKEEKPPLVAPPPPAKSIDDTVKEMEKIATFFKKLDEESFKRFKEVFEYSEQVTEKAKPKAPSLDKEEGKPVGSVTETEKFRAAMMDYVHSRLNSQFRSEQVNFDKLKERQRQAMEYSLREGYPDPRTSGGLAYSYYGGWYQRPNIGRTQYLPFPPAHIKKRKDDFQESLFAEKGALAQRHNELRENVVARVNSVIDMNSVAGRITDQYGISLQINGILDSVAPIKVK